MKLLLSDILFNAQKPELSTGRFETMRAVELIAWYVFRFCACFRDDFTLFCFSYVQL